MSEELRPCPFCGGEAELCYSEVDTFCRKCNVMQETELWNTRPIEDALNKRIAELEAAQRWIPVSERLPEKQKLTIGFTDNSAYVFFEIVNDDEMGLVMYPYQNRKGTVTHWMPLPSTPEVQE